MGCACGGRCGGRDPLGMGYLRGLAAYGLGQDDGSDSEEDDSYDTTTDTSITGGSVIPAGTVFGPSVPSGLNTSTPAADASSVSAFCSSQGETYNATTDLCNVTTSSGSGTINASQLDAALTQLLNGGTQIAKIATGTTGSLTVTSNELLIGAAVLAAIFILPAAFSAGRR